MGPLEIDKLLKNPAFAPEKKSAMKEAFREACRLLHLSGENTPPNMNLIAKKIMEIAGNGETDPVVMCAQSLNEFFLSKR